MRALLLLPVLLAAAQPPAAAQRELPAPIKELAAREQYEAAMERLTDFLQAHPDHVEARLFKGVIFRRQGNLDEATRIFKALAKDHPNLPEPYNNLAVVHAAQGRYDEAHRALLKAIEIDPGYDTAYENLGDLHTKLAAISYERAHRLNKENARARRKSEVLSRLVGPPESLSERTAPAAETELIEQDDDETSTATAIPSSSDLSCYTVTDLATETQARSVAEWLERSGARVRVRESPEDQPGSYIVYLPPLENREVARREAQRLREQGIRDLQIIPRGTRKHGIALGVYNNRENAQRRVAGLEELGYAVRVEPLRDPERGWTVAAEAGAGTLQQEPFKERFPEHALQPKRCP